jgi:hypothetical protein
MNLTVTAVICGSGNGKAALSPCPKSVGFGKKTIVAASETAGE